MKKKAVFPGSFDPVTLGHEALVLRSLPIFDEIVVAIGNNALKQYFFSVDKRKFWLEHIFADFPQVSVVIYDGLTIDFCREIDANYILRGLRTSADFEFERSIAQINKMLYPEIETVFLLTSPENTPVSSSIVRDVFRNGGDVSMFIPKGIDLTI